MLRHFYSANYDSYPFIQQIFIECLWDSIELSAAWHTKALYNTVITLKEPIQSSKTLHWVEVFGFCFYIYQFILKGVIRIQMSSQMKGYTGPGMWEGARGFHALSGHTNLPCVHQFSSSGLFSFKKHWKKTMRLKASCFHMIQCWIPQVYNNFWKSQVLIFIYSLLPLLGTWSWFCDYF